MQPILACHGIEKTFRQWTIPSSLLQDTILKFPRGNLLCIHALRNVSLDIAPGEWVGMYGPNGSGKTTLLKILAGLMEPDAGEITRAEDASCFFDLGASFHPERSAMENVRLECLLHGVSTTDIPALMETVIDFAGLQTYRELPVKCYSTGMRMRLGFSLAVHVPSDVLLLDEVAAVGDAAFQEQCWEKFQELKRAGKTVLMVSHSLEGLERVCDRIVFMEEGAIVREMCATPIAL